MKRVLASIAALTVSVSAGAVAAQETPAGMQLFQQYCATCHGADGAGKGPLTDLLTVNVPDLTGLSARNDGTFPMLEVIHIIDGRTGVRSHGGPMPVYGNIFTRETDMVLTYDATIEARGMILSLAYYLEGVQK